MSGLYSRKPNMPELYEKLSELSGISAERLQELREGENVQMTLDETQLLANALLALPDQQLYGLVDL